MTKTKKLLSVLLSLVMMLSITAGVNMTAFAELMPEGVYNGFQYAQDDEDGTMLIIGYKGTPGTTLEFPSEINKIPVKEICYYFAHYNGGSQFEKVEDVIIPASITKISDDTLCADCFKSLKNIYYRGTKAQWNKIEIGYSFGNNKEAIENATIHCSDGIINCKHTYKTTTTKATTKKNGKIVKKCSVCGESTTTTIYYPKTITLSTTSYTYNGKVKKPSVIVKDSKGNKISASNYTVTYQSGRKNVGKYTVTIKFKGNYSGTVKKTFTIKPKSTSISKLTAKSKGFTVKWKKQSTQTTGYQIQYSTSSKFKSAKTVTVSKNKTTSKTISKLKAKKKYYVRVRTYKTVKVNGKNTKIYSGWSKAKAVTTKK